VQIIAIRQQLTVTSNNNNILTRLQHTKLRNVEPLSLYPYVDER